MSRRRALTLSCGVSSGIISRRLKGQGHTLFVTTQYVGEAAYCDYVGVMRNGKLLMVETPEMLRYRALNGHVVDLRTKDLLNSELVAALEAHPLVKGECCFPGSRYGSDYGGRRQYRHSPTAGMVLRTRARRRIN